MVSSTDNLIKIIYFSIPQATITGSLYWLYTAQHKKKNTCYYFLAEDHLQRMKLLEMMKLTAMVLLQFLTMSLECWWSANFSALLVSINSFSLTFLVRCPWILFQSACVNTDTWFKSIGCWISSNDSFCPWDVWGLGVSANNKKGFANYLVQEYKQLIWILCWHINLPNNSEATLALQPTVTYCVCHMHAYYCTRGVFFSKH